jgi:chorismate lyase / 3-hydroxybenzoate synthase
MSSIPHRASSIQTAVPDGAFPQPPPWATELVADGIASVIRGVRVCQSTSFSLLSLAAPAPAGPDAAKIEQITADAYHTLAKVLHEAGNRHPVRIWNFVPGILSPVGDGLDRYMKFNAGRYQAFSQWFGGAGEFSRFLPAASAVGHQGNDLVIHVLAARDPGVAVANPRQLAPYRYSRRFGPLPPCFARATRVSAPGGRDLLMVGGTASVRGEDSVHVGNLPAQLQETFANLAALAGAAWPEVAGDLALKCFSGLRVYHVRAADLSMIRSAVAAAFAHPMRVEWFHADLCRGDLLVEIEGLAERRLKALSS